jgi:hypothetical protein
VLAAVTLVGSAWTFADLRFGDGSWLHPPEAPLGPLVELLPRWSADGAAPALATAAVVAGLVVLVVREATNR